MHLFIRKIENDDVEAIANIFSKSLLTLTFLPILYSQEEKDWFVKNMVVSQCDIFVAVRNAIVISFIAIDLNEIKHLYTHPRYQSCGAGSALIQFCQARYADLKLWCFQENLNARSFYEKFNFKPVKLTDGGRNEEKLPDILYEWTK